MVILPTAYMGHVAYYAALLSAEDYRIELCENYTKQSFRSRCDLLSSNGRQTLSIPIVRRKGEKLLVKDAEIEYVTSWQKQHWRSMVSAYASSAFFPEYEAEFAPLYERKERFLVDFNARLHEVILACLEVDAPGGFTERYLSDSEYESQGIVSLREELSDKKITRTNCTDTYYQVFGDKFEFEPCLSVVDTLFCEGAAGTKEYLLKLGRL